MNNTAQPFYNAMRPFIDLTNANIESFLRFARSPEISEVAKVGFEKYLEFANASFTRLVASNAFAEWNRAVLNNYSHFTTQYVESLSSITAQTQELISRQTEQGTRSLQQISEATSRAANAGMDTLKKAAAR
jgi:hypothetical protein